MKKKHIVLISIFVILIVASLLTMYFLKDADGSNDTFDPLNSLENWDWVQEGLPEESYDRIAENMGITREELDEIITTPLDLTEDQQKEIKDILIKYYVPEVDRFIEDDDPNDNVYTYIDTNGDVGTMTLNTPNLTDEENEEYNSAVDDFLAMLENEDIPLEDIAPPILDDYANTNEQEDTGTEDDKDGYNGELEGTNNNTDTTDYWKETYGLAAEEIRSLSDEEKIALGFTQQSDGNWVDEDYFMLPPPPLSEEDKEILNESSEGVNWNG